MQCQRASWIDQQLHTSTRVKHCNHVGHVSNSTGLVDGDASGVNGAHVVVPVVQVLLVRNEEHLIEPPTAVRSNAKLDNGGNVVANGDGGELSGRRVGQLFEATMYVKLVNWTVSVH